MCLNKQINILDGIIGMLNTKATDTFTEITCQTCRSGHLSVKANNTLQFVSHEREMCAVEPI